MSDRVSRRFRASFPAGEPGFRTGAWQAGIPGFGEALSLFSHTTVEALIRAAESTNAGVRYYPDDERAAPITTPYSTLLEQVKAVAGALAAQGVKRNDRVLIVLPSGVEFFAVFFGAQWLGAIPVPSYPPAALERVETALDRLAHIGGHSRSCLLVTSSQLRPVLGDVARRVKSIRSIVAVEGLEGAKVKEPVKLHPDDPCFIQYTSGSTGNPKGVLLSHRNITSSMHVMGVGLELRRTDAAASWLPLYHDMGLIGGALTPVYWQLPLALMSPLAFLSKPLRWLKMMEANRSTFAAAPNFAYGLCVRRTTPEERASLNLSEWRLALNGAEPVNPRTVDEFCAAFEPSGFSRDAVFPCYGLAESSLAVCFTKPGANLSTISVDRGQLADGRVVKSNDEAATRLVCVGQPVAAHRVLVVDEFGEQVEDGEVGHILVKGPTVMSGYFQDQDATDKVLRDDFLWTGDLGFFQKEGLYVTGRSKDLIIVRGKNYYAEDVEACLEKVDGVRGGGSVAFAIYDDERARDAVIAVCETKEEDPAARAAMVEALTTRVAEECSLSLEEVVLVRPGTIPKTSSGKRQRSLTRERYLAGELEPARTDALGVASVFVRSAVGFLAMAGRKLGASRRVPETE